MKPEVLIVGANALPVAVSAGRKFNVSVANYFSDVDFDCGKFNVVSLESFGVPLNSKNLVDLAVEKFSGVLDYAVPVSGVGENHVLLGRLEKHFKILGNPSGVVEKAKNFHFLSPVLDELEIKRPKVLYVNNKENLNFPVVLKFHPKKFKTLLVESREEFDSIAEDFKGKGAEIVAYEYVEGIPASASLLSTGKECVILSINEQIIGLKELGAGNLTYCGHVTPLCVSDDALMEIEKFKSLVLKVGCVGSVGVDFLLTKENKVFFTEINPRFQDTLQAVEEMRKINLFEKHVSAICGEISGIKAHEKPDKKFFVKGILYAEKEINVQSRIKMRGVSDIPRQGRKIGLNQPICSIFLKEDTREEGIRKLISKADKIRKIIS